MSENGARHELAVDPYPSYADQPGDRYADGPWANSDYVPDTSKGLPVEVGHAIGEWARQQDAYQPNQFPGHDRDAERELAERNPGALERYEHGLSAHDELKNISATCTQRPTVPPPGWLVERTREWAEVGRNVFGWPLDREAAG